MNTVVQVPLVVEFVRKYGPVTPMETRFAFAYPTDTFAQTVLEEISQVTGKLSGVAGYWTAKCTLSDVITKYEGEAE